MVVRRQHDCNGDDKSAKTFHGSRRSGKRGTQAEIVRSATNNGGSSTSFDHDIEGVLRTLRRAKRYRETMGKTSLPATGEGIKEIFAHSTGSKLRWYNLQEGKHCFFKFRLSESRCILHVELKARKGDPDLYISRRFTHPTQRQFTWASAQEGADIVTIGPTDADFGTGMYYIGVDGHDAQGEDRLEFAVVISILPVRRPMGEGRVTLRKQLSRRISRLQVDSDARKALDTSVKVARQEKRSRLKQSALRAEKFRRRLREIDHPVTGNLPATAGSVSTNTNIASHLKSHPPSPSAVAPSSSSSSSSSSSFPSSHSSSKYSTEESTRCGFSFINYNADPSQVRKWSPRGRLEAQRLAIIRRRNRHERVRFRRNTKKDNEKKAKQYQCVGNVLAKTKSSVSIASSGKEERKDDQTKVDDEIGKWEGDGPFVDTYKGTTPILAVNTQPAGTSASTKDSDESEHTAGKPNKRVAPKGKQDRSTMTKKREPLKRKKNKTIRTLDREPWKKELGDKKEVDRKTDDTEQSLDRRRRKRMWWLRFQADWASKNGPDKWIGPQWCKTVDSTLLSRAVVPAAPQQDPYRERKITEEWFRKAAPIIHTSRKQEIRLKRERGLSRQRPKTAAAAGKRRRSDIDKCTDGRELVSNGHGDASTSTKAFRPNSAFAFSRAPLQGQSCSSSSSGHETLDTQACGHGRIKEGVRPQSSNPRYRQIASRHHHHHHSQRHYRRRPQTAGSLDKDKTTVAKQSGEGRPVRSRVRPHSSTVSMAMVKRNFSTFVDDLCQSTRAPLVTGRSSSRESTKNGQGDQSTSKHTKNHIRDSAFPSKRDFAVATRVAHRHRDARGHGNDDINEYSTISVRLLQLLHLKKEELSKGNLKRTVEILRGIIHIYLEIIIAEQKGGVGYSPEERLQILHDTGVIARLHDHQPPSSRKRLGQRQFSISEGNTGSTDGKNMIEGGTSSPTPSMMMMSSLSEERGGRGRRGHEGRESFRAALKTVGGRLELNSLMKLPPNAVIMCLRDLMTESIEEREKLLEFLRQKELTAGSTTIVALQNDVWMRGSVTEGSYRFYSCTIVRKDIRDELSSCIVMEMKCDGDGDADLYASGGALFGHMEKEKASAKNEYSSPQPSLVPCPLSSSSTTRVHYNKFPTQSNYSWGSAGEGDDEITIPLRTLGVREARGRPIRGYTFYVGVAGATDCDYQIRWKLKEMTPAAPGEESSQISLEEAKVSINDVIDTSRLGLKAQQVGKDLLKLNNDELVEHVLHHDLSLACFSVARLRNERNLIGMTHRNRH